MPKQTCQHLRLRRYIFSDGQQIVCCPDCTYGDTARRAILGFNTVLRPWWHKEHVEPGYTTVTVAKQKQEEQKQQDIEQDIEQGIEVEDDIEQDIEVDCDADETELLEVL